MKNTLTYLAIAAVVAACHGNSGTLQRKDQQQYEVVQEGQTSGVTSTINAPGETPPPEPMTGTNDDTTSTFSLPQVSTTGTQNGQPGTIAGTLPQQAPPPPRPVRPPQTATTGTVTTITTPTETIITNTTAATPRPKPVKKPPKTDTAASPPPATSTVPPGTDTAPPPPPSTDTSTTTNGTKDKKDDPPSTQTDTQPPPTTTT